MLPWAETQTEATEGGLLFLGLFLFFFPVSQLPTAMNAAERRAVLHMSITEDEYWPATLLPRGADTPTISNRDWRGCKQTAGPRASAWKGGRKRFAASSAWLSASPWDGFLYVGFSWGMEG